MAGTRGLGRRMRFVWLAGALLAALAVPSVATAVPTAPGLRDATVYQGGVGVTVWWTASIDSDAGSIQYAVYRDDVPMTLTNYLANGELVLTTSDTTVTVTPKADEIAKKFTYYYLVVATNTTTSLKSVSTNVAPNVHGGLRSGMPTLNCQLCHNVHGVGDENYLGAATRYKCYRCHGGTTASTGYGDKAVRNVQKDFYDYTGMAPDRDGDPDTWSAQEGQWTGSRHYNQQNVTAQTECTMCHTPHKSPYYVNPLTALKEDARSYTQLLSVKRLDATYFYSKDDAVAGNAFCFECHGSSTTTLDSNAGPGAYDRTAGDHNSANYATTAAHGNTQVYPNADGHRTNPAVQCEACHNKHASPANKLIAYRNDDYVGATTTTYAQAELCYACHSAAGYAAEVAAGTATGNTNFAWNSRDVKAQFGKASKHPTTARVGGPMAESGSWSQTSQADFAGDTLVDTVATASGNVELETLSGGPLYFSDGFESNALGSWDADPTYWETTPVDKSAGSYAARGFATGTTRRTDYLVKSIDVSGRTNVILSYAWKVTGFIGGTDYFRVEYYSGGAWNQLFDRTSSSASWATRNDPIPATATQVRFTSSVNSTTEFCYIDDVSLTSDPLPYTYAQSGNVASVSITPVGSLEQWGTLTYDETQPGGTNLTVDVLDAANDSVLLVNAADGADLSALSASSLKLRANLTGAAPTPRTAADDFNDNSFDTAKWADYRLNGSDDPDAALPVPWSDMTDFENAGAWPAAWTRTGDNYWAVATAIGQNGTYAAQFRHTSGAQRTGNFERTFDLSAVSNPQLTFRVNAAGLDWADTYYVRYSVNGGAWQYALAANRNNSAWTTMGPYTLNGAAGSANVRIDFGASTSSDTNEYIRFDDIVIAGTTPGVPTNDWPKETGGQLQLRAEGPAFDATNGIDEGEFVYVKPTTADWVDTEDFDLVVKVAATPGAGAGYRAGLMIRAGSTEANAQARGASMAGVYATNTNVTFEYRTTAGLANASGGDATGTAPEWLKLERRGTTITAKSSDNGSTWTTVGSGTMTINAGDFVLAGIALTSGTNATFAEGTWDDFSITEAGITATATPALLDWAVSYTAYPPVTTGSLTCVSCHNVHSVQKGTVGTAWQVIRASLPSNTKTTAAGTPTQFCLDCHDGSAPTTASNSATVLVPYTVEFSDKSAYPFFPGWNKTTAGADWAGGAHASTTFGLLQGQIGCQTCHDPHASDNARLTAYSYQEDAVSNNMHTGTVTRNNSITYAEENLCYACHDTQSGGNCTGCHGSNLLTLNTKTPLIPTPGSSMHPVVSVTGVHFDTETAANLGDGKRHAECADCHDPHVAQAGLHTATPNTSLAGGALRGAIGVIPGYPAHNPANPAHAGNWTTVLPSNYTLERMDGETDDFEAYVCLKCHSSYVTLPASVPTGSSPGTYKPTDVAREFNPSNFSEHNVFGQSIGMESAFTFQDSSGDTITTTWVLPTNSFFAVGTGYTMNSKITCTDCHSGDMTAPTTARGPHGSTADWLMDPMYTSDWKTTRISGTTNGMSNTTNICAKCHDLNGPNSTGSWSNAAHEESDHNNLGCNGCHIKIPHGWGRPRLLGQRTDNAAYAATSMDGYNWDEPAYLDQGMVSWNDEDMFCDDACGKHDGGSTANRWPAIP